MVPISGARAAAVKAGQSRRMCSLDRLRFPAPVGHGAEHRAAVVARLPAAPYSAVLFLAVPWPQVRHWNRALATLLAAAAAGFLVWFTPHFNRWSTGGYWGVIAVVTLAGVLIGLSQLHGRDGNPTASFLLAFVPVLVAAGWVILAGEPRGDWVRDHVVSWSGDIGIGHAIHNLTEHVAVLAFGLGAVFGVTFEPKMLRRSSRSPNVIIGAPLRTPPPHPSAARIDESPTQETPPA